MAKDISNIHRTHKLTKLTFNTYNRLVLSSRVLRDHKHQGVLIIYLVPRYKIHSLTLIID